MNVVLIGMPGSGKTTIGKILAKKMKLGFYDLEERVSECFDESIGDLVKRHGYDWLESRLREHELRISRVVSSRVLISGGLVVSTEECTVHQEGVMAAFNKYATVVFLDTPMYVLDQRLDQGSEYLFLGERFLTGDLRLGERMRLLNEYSHIRVRCSDSPVEKVAARTITALKEFHKNKP